MTRNTIKSINNNLQNQIKKIEEAMDSQEIFLENRTDEIK